jgi:leucine dehydrogenase
VAVAMAEPAAPVGSAWPGEQLVLCRDERVGLHAVIAIDDTTLGPGLGGIRLKRYPSVDAGIRECCRLAAGMTRKNALAELPFGGAKAVILQEGEPVDRPALMRRFGDFVARTGGAYLPGVDMGTTVEDLGLIGQAGGAVSCSHDDPSPWTATGVHAALRAAVEHVDGRLDLRGVRVVVQGVGHVGAALACEIAHQGASVLVADVDRDRAAAVARRIGGIDIDPDRVIGTPCDVYAPCAQGGVLNETTIGRLDCRIVVGAANDTLDDPADADRLAARGITYVPDFVANAGGVVHIHAAREGWEVPRLREEVLRIGTRVEEILERARERDTTPFAIAEERAAGVLAAHREPVA